MSNQPSSDSLDHPNTWQRWVVVVFAVVCVCSWTFYIQKSSTAQAADVSPAPSDPTQVSFSRSIRPLLSNSCYTCHGPDSATRKAGLRLDLKDGLYGPTKKDPKAFVIIPGNLRDSVAWQRIISSNPDEVMPPPTNHVQLSLADKDLLRRWIEQGAKWEPHWAFIPPVRPAPPEVKHATWVKNDLDRFILAKLEQEKIEPSPEADKVTLIRRVTLDLTGLPPTPAEIDAFTTDESANAYEKVVDRLFASPRYGEKMAIQWLDYARYADSHGYQSDWQRFMYPWRDYVIKSFNDNKPFDTFSIEQLAGDLIPNATEEQLLASGFHRNHRINTEGGIIPEEWRVETVVDRVETTGAVWMGLTLGCARCHDHKYDPVTQKEFYQFSAFFNSIEENGTGAEKPGNVPPIMKLPTPEQKVILADLQKKLDETKPALTDIEKKLDTTITEWEAGKPTYASLPGRTLHIPLDGDAKAITADNTTLEGKIISANDNSFGDGKIGKAYNTQNTGSIDLGDLATQTADKPFSISLWINLPAGNGKGAILSRMEGADQKYHGYDIWMQDGKLGMHLIDQFPENALKVVTKEIIPAKKWQHIAITYDGSKKAMGVKVYVDGKLKPVDIENDKLTGDFKPTASLIIGRRSKTDPWNGMVDDIQFFDRQLSMADVTVLARYADLEKILAIAPKDRTDDQKKMVTDFHRATDPQWASINAKTIDTQLAMSKLDMELPTVMVMRERTTPRDTFILIRGQYDKPGDKVTQGVPSCLPPLPKDAPLNRLTMAKWIMSDDNPLTARVLANRTWERFFGTGIVKSSENMGQQADWPSHEELLDYLATELHRLQWDLKAFQKEIVMSATYRQANTHRPELAERDPDNRWLAYSPRLRLPAETIRDQALYVSGLLVEKIGGPPVRPYSLPGVWDETGAYGNLLKYKADEGDGLYRRSMYTIWKRTAAPPSMMTFDAPGREICTIKRQRTNTPLQALALMNETTYVEAARELAERMINEGGTTPLTRLGYGFRLVVGRAPTQMEMDILAHGFQKQLAGFNNKKEDAEKLLAIGARPRNPNLDVIELAAYTMSASTLINLDETITRP